VELDLSCLRQPGHASSGLIIADSLNAAITQVAAPAIANGQVTIVAGGTAAAANPLTINVGDTNTHVAQVDRAVTIQTAHQK